MLGPRGFGWTCWRLAAVASGQAFALAPPGWTQPLPPSVRWLPLDGHPLVRRTWAAWPATSRRRDLGHFVGALERAVRPPHAP